MKSVLALLVAVAMVAGALLLRSRLDRAEPPDDGDPDVVVTPSQQGGLRVTCASEVAAACNTLDAVVTIEDGVTTADRLVAADAPDVDVWVAPGPLVRLVDEARDRAGRPPLFAETVAPVARSPLVLLVWRDRAEVLTSACDTVGWACVGDVAAGTWEDIGGETTWGPVKPGHGDPTRDATGLLVLGQAVAEFIGRPQVSTADFGDDAFLSWLTDLERAVPSFGSGTQRPLTQMLTQGPAAYDALGVTEAEAVLALSRSARRDQLQLIYPPAAATFDLVAAGVAPGHASSATMAPLAGALAEQGWRTTADPPPDLPVEPPALPAEEGLPPAGALDALRGVWQEVVR